MSCIGSSEGHRAIRYIHNPRRWNQQRGKKGGTGISYSGHKHQKGDKELTIVDNNGFVLDPITVKPVNQQDMVIFPESLTKLLPFRRNPFGISESGLCHD